MIRLRFTGNGIPNAIGQVAASVSTSAFTFSLRKIAYLSGPIGIAAFSACESGLLIADISKCLAKFYKNEMTASCTALLIATKIGKHALTLGGIFAGGMIGVSLMGALPHISPFILIATFAVFFGIASGVLISKVSKVVERLITKKFFIKNFLKYCAKRLKIDKLD